MWRLGWETSKCARLHGPLYRASARAAASRNLATLRVKADVDKSKLAGAILAHVRQKEPTDLDAMGDKSVSSAVKAIALANMFDADVAGPGAGVAFVPSLPKDTEADKKLIRLAVVKGPKGKPIQSAGQADAGQADSSDEFARGGIYVPVDVAAAGPRGAVTSESRNGKGDGGRSEKRVATPTELARTVLGEWMRFAAPEVRHARRAAAAARATGKPAVETPFVPEKKGRQRPPFLVTIGPPALSRAVKALAFTSSDLKKEASLAKVPPFVVVPHLVERHGHERKTGEKKLTRLVILQLVHCPDSD